MITRMGLATGPGVVFLFTDIEGSTRTERAVGSAVWAEVVGRHDELMRRAIEGHGGSVVKTEGDAFFAAFPGAAEAVAAAVDAQRALAAESWADGAVDSRPDGDPPGRGAAAGAPRTGRP